MKSKMVVLTVLVSCAICWVGPSRSLEASHRACADYGQVIYPGTTLYPCDSMTSESGRLRLDFQGDGNLVLYDTLTSDWIPMWATNTFDGGAYFRFRQPTSSEGNLEIINGNLILWFNNTGDFDNSNPLFLLAQNDGNLVLYRHVDGHDEPIWDSGTWF
jgi:hypothetical protein